jgi:nucleoside-diphosphate kinase
MKQKTLIILKPDCIQRMLAGETISRFEKRGLKIVGLKITKITKDKAEYHYAEHKGKSFYDDLVKFITSGPVIIMVLEGNEAVSIARKIAGETKLDDLKPGTIRGDYVMQTGRNIVHTSDSIDSASREIKNFFDTDEIIEYERDIDKWI